MFGEMLSELSKLENINRYSNEIMLKRTNVASHTTYVSMISTILAYKEEELGREVDMSKLLLRCQFHDIMEVYTGDIISYVKRATPEFENEVENIEKIFFEQFKEKIPKSWRDDFKDFIFNAKDRSIEGKILKASDSIDVLRESIREIKLGNKETFIEVLNNTLEILTKIDLPSVNFFLKNEIESFGIDKRYINENILEKIENL